MQNYHRNIKNEKSAKIIGLTGGIASGKTVATTALVGAGYNVIDADEVSRELFACGTTGEIQLMRAFPQAVQNGRLDRASLRKIISTDDDARKTLNELTHPAIVTRIKELTATATPPVILSAPLLFETGLSALCDVTVCMYCPRSLRIKRLTERDGMADDDAVRMIDAQIPDAIRCTMSDHIVASDLPADEFRTEIVRLIEHISAR